MIDWDSYGHRQDITGLHEEINRLTHLHDGPVDYWAIERRCRQLRNAYMREATKDVFTALKRWMAQAGRCIALKECAGHESH